MNPFFLAVGAEDSVARQALAHNGLASHAQEWNREWQRAQARAWLHATPGPGISQDHPGELPGGAPHAHRMHAVVPGSCAVVPSSAAQGASQPSAYLRTVAAPIASLALPVQQCSTTFDGPPSVEPGQPDIASHSRHATRQAPSERETVHRTTPVAHESRSEQGKLQLHVECADGGLHVWIGVHGDAALVSARAAAILAELRRAAHIHLAPLALVVCNGRTLYSTCVRAHSLPETSP